MKVLCVVGSKRKDGNSHAIADIMLKYLENFKYDTELITISDYNFEGCNGCEGCNKTNECVVDDDMQKIYKKVDEADVLVCVSPTYYYNVTSDMKKFIERLYAYQIFDENDRSNWTSVNDKNGRKIAVTIALYEQAKADGFTKEAMSKPLDDLGYDVVCEEDFTLLYDKNAAHNSTSIQLDVLKCADKIILSKKS